MFEHTYTIIVEANYASNADDTFEEALDVSEMQDAMRGLAVYHGLPQRPIHEGETLVVDVTMLKLFTTRNHVMHVERLDRAARVIQSRERNDGIQRWDHTLSIQPSATGCVWRDTVILEAGRWSWLTARFCRFVYTRRHRVRQAQSIRALVVAGECHA
ncbi:hypothetical protein [Phaeobacter inhibens]|uniref:hypothetical protein n=1 Tax=Phaeobacter inhibens TaxID=221822 RepID=UPI0021A6ABB2|nr:hypothetical protein [Phaeobacter inhibens]UWR47024.1 hypothetical protein K4F86_18530 [Phaeobacter inhibens]UWR90480.1 hypothetical protein K4L01_18050 [Phaeobacter inhibens]